MGAQQLNEEIIHENNFKLRKNMFENKKCCQSLKFDEKCIKSITDFLLDNLTILCIYFMLIIGLSNNDKNTLNAMTLILVEFIFEFFLYLPNWKRRQFLLLDEILRIFYTTSELWHEKAYHEIFKPENYKKRITLR